jgi:hypothetical protein
VESAGNAPEIPQSSFLGLCRAPAAPAISPLTGCAPELHNSRHLNPVPQRGLMRVFRGPPVFPLRCDIHVQPAFPLPVRYGLLETDAGREQPHHLIAETGCAAAFTTSGTRIETYFAHEVGKTAAIVQGGVVLSGLLPSSPRTTTTGEYCRTDIQLSILSQRPIQAESQGTDSRCDVAMLRVTRLARLSNDRNYTFSSPVSS